MKAEKIEIVTTVTDVELDVKEITLLSADEYRKNIDYILTVNHWWWLRSPGYESDLALLVSCVGALLDYGYFVYFDSGWVRPALRVSNLKSLDLKLGDDLGIANRDWTVISDDLVLADEPIGRCVFRKNWKAEDANDYNASDVKKYLENWANENGIEINKED